MLAPGDYGTLLVMCAAVAALSAMLLWSPLGSRNDVPAVDAGR
jgi:hypothetical protein